MVRLLRHRQTKGLATDRPHLTHRATSRLHPVGFQAGATFRERGWIEWVIATDIAWGKFDKAEPYARKVLAMRERQYGHDSRMVVSSLQTLIDILRGCDFIAI
jgi:hypothetical protein